MKRKMSKRWGSSPDLHAFDGWGRPRIWALSKKGPRKKLPPPPIPLGIFWGRLRPEHGSSKQQLIKAIITLNYDQFEIRKYLKLDHTPETSKQKATNGVRTQPEMCARIEVTEGSLKRVTTLKARCSVLQVVI